MSHDLLPASLYNDLPQVEDQTPIPDAVLSNLGKLFMSYDMQDRLGVSLLHRHFDLDAGEVMVHKGLRCSPKNLSNKVNNLAGASFYLSGGYFRAFEYDTDEPLELEERFLSDVASYLASNGLAGHVVLSKLDREYNRLMETLDEETRSHICTSVPEREVSLAEQVTEWRFDVSRDNQVRPVIARLCKKGTLGAHKRTGGGG